MPVKKGRDRGVTHYFSTFITGFEEPITAALRSKLAGVQIDLVLDGLIVYRARATTDQIRGLRFFNNSFVLFNLFPRLRTDPIPSIIAKVLDDPALEEKVAAHAPPGQRSFRLVTSRENQLVAVDRQLRAKLEERIAFDRRLRPASHKPDLEFWCLSRSEGYGFFGLRLTRHADYAKTLSPGELRPELAHILCLLSEPGGGDLFLDPCCGSGAIPLERARSFPYRTIIAGDRDETAVSRLARKVKGRPAAFTVLRLDALEMTQLAPESVDKVVTDPPWGLFAGVGGDLATFYFDLLNELHRVVRRGGLVVILTARKDLVDDFLRRFADRFELVASYATLVSGKKAGVYKMRRTTPD